MNCPAFLYKWVLVPISMIALCLAGVDAFADTGRKASKPPINRAELLSRFDARQWVEERRIRGEDLVSIISEYPGKIQIRRSVIEDGLDFSRTGPISSESVAIIESEIRPSPLTRSLSSGFALYAPGVGFPGAVDLTGTIVAGPANFSKATFSEGPFTLHKTTFQKPADFSGAIFEETVLAQQAGFESGATFSGARFHKMVFLSGIKSTKDFKAAGAEFHEITSFRKSRFHGRADFQGARFEKGAYFMGAGFIGTAYFRDTVFSGKSRFEDAVFEETVSFTGAAFHQNAAFDRVRFHRRVRFSELDSAPVDTDPVAVFHEEASFVFARIDQDGRFNGVHFNKKAAFLKTRFGGPIQFSDARFQEEAWFTDSQFHQEARFQRTEFHGKARFERVRFDAFADFLLARFHTDVTFHHTRFTDAVMFESDFNGRADFQETLFEGRADFAGRTFRGPADFESATFESRAVFRHTAFLDLARFRQARFQDTLVLRYASFPGILDFRNARITRLDFNSRDRPTVIEGRVDFRKATVFASHFQDLVFASEVDLSDATFGPPLHESGTARQMADSRPGRPPDPADGTTLLRYVTFEDRAYLIRTRFEGPLGLETVSFRGPSDWREAQFSSEKKIDPALTISYVNFSDTNIRWRQLPPIARWATESNRIRSFLEARPVQASEHRSEKRKTGGSLQPRSQALHGLEISFRRQNRLTDANQVHYHRKRAELEEARRNLGMAERWPLELEWAGWGLLSGYGTRLGWSIFWCLFFVLIFAGIYAAFGRIDRQPAPQTGSDFSLRLRILELPRSYLQDARPGGIADPRLKKFLNALRLSAVVLFKVGYRDTRIAGRRGGSLLHWVLVLEWVIGFFLIGILLVTLTNTQPVLHSLLSQLF